jgi:hypothetical protein
MYNGEPTLYLLGLTNYLILIAKPKSAILIFLSSVIKRFAGFRSL